MLKQIRELQVNMMDDVAWCHLKNVVLPFVNVEMLKWWLRPFDELFELRSVWGTLCYLQVVLTSICVL